MWTKDLQAKLKKANIKITELAYYLNISRPTLYKYIEQYNIDEVEHIPEQIKCILDLIDNSNWEDKKQTFGLILEIKKLKGISIEEKPIRKLIEKDLELLCDENLEKVSNFISNLIKEKSIIKAQEKDGN